MHNMHVFTVAVRNAKTKLVALPLFQLVVVVLNHRDRRTGIGDFARVWLRIDGRTTGHSLYIPAGPTEWPWILQSR